MKMSRQSIVNEILHEMEVAPVFIVLIGAPGTGKTTFIKTLQEALNEKGKDNIVVASTDNLLEIEAAKLGLTYSEAWGKVNFKGLEREFKAQIAATCAEKKDIVIDRTNMSSKGRATVMKDADGYHKIAINFDVPHDDLMKRLRKRGEATGKIISEMVVRQMYKNYSAPTKSEGFQKIFEIIQQ